MGSTYADGSSGYYWTTYTADDTAGNNVKWEYATTNNYKITTNTDEWKLAEWSTTLTNPLDILVEQIKKSFPEFWEQNMFLPAEELVEMLLNRLKRIDSFLDRLGIDYKGEKE